MNDHLFAPIIVHDSDGGIFYIYTNKDIAVFFKHYFTLTSPTIQVYIGNINKFKQLLDPTKTGKLTFRIRILILEFGGSTQIFRKLYFWKNLQRAYLDIIGIK